MPTLLSRLLLPISGYSWSGSTPGQQLFSCILSGVLGLLAPSISLAGGGAENVFLVVNSNSTDSLTVANHYITLRKLPAQNVFYLPYTGSRSVTTSPQFREKVLLPCLTEIEKRQLQNQVDYLVYSCDFPWRINLQADFPKEKFPPQLSPHASLTGATFLWPFIKAKRKEIVSLQANLYCTESLHGLTISRAFRSRYRWAAGGKRTGAAGIPYMLSSMLGVTDGRGNSVEEIVRCLETAQRADNTKPSGTVYFMKHSGPRSKPRHDLFEAAATELRRAGVTAKVISDKFPTGQKDIAGLTCGTPYQKLETSKCRFLPGAFCDNFTSFGAIFTQPKVLVDPKTGKRKKFQITTADFIRHGATAASGTVIEPYSIRQKFPLPSVHVHYANGCSLGEAFYQSVSGPYQQLLVGDPLCQPWAKPPVVEMPELSPGKRLSGTVKLSPTVKSHEAEISSYELFVGDQRMQSCKPGEHFLLDTTKLADGYHELRVVATEATPIETQGSLLAQVIVKNGQDAIGLTTQNKQPSLANETLVLEVASTATAEVSVYCNSLLLGTIENGNGQLSIATEKIGAGPVTLRAVSQNLQSAPLSLEIAP